MALAKDIMGGGFSAGQAQAIQGQVAPTVTAAGTNQGTAFALQASINYLSTVAASTGVILPSVPIGDSVDVFNGGANACVVYPPTGGKINQVATNGGVNCPTNTWMVFKKVTSTQWIAMQSA